MAKADALGGGLGRKPVATSAPAVVGTDFRDGDGYVTKRLHAFTCTVQALGPLNTIERTQVVAAVAEFYRLSVTVEN
jgi:hypothetical protein